MIKEKDEQNVWKVRVFKFKTGARKFVERGSPMCVSSNLTEFKIFKFFHQSVFFIS